MSFSHNNWWNWPLCLPILIQAQIWFSVCFGDIYVFEFVFPRTQWNSQCVFRDISNIHNTLLGRYPRIEPRIHSVSKKSPKTLCYQRKVDDYWKETLLFENNISVFWETFQKFEISSVHNALENLALNLGFILS